MKLEKRNAYFCKKCRKVTITVDIDEGVTPMFIQCPDCKELASSFMYQIPGCMRFTFDAKGMKIIPADYEWYKPDKKTKLTEGDKTHVNNGGLLMRKRTNKPAITKEIN